MLLLLGCLDQILLLSLTKSWESLQMWNMFFLDSEACRLQNWQEDGVQHVSISAQLVDKVCAVASSGSGQNGVPCSTELSGVYYSTMCGNGSKQQY